MTEYPDDLLDYILTNVHRGATFWEANGAFSNSQRWVILTVVNRSQALRLRTYLRKTDPHAFVYLSNSSEIYGKGFMST